MVESQPPNNPAPRLSPLRGTFVGRQREMGELKVALDEALSGQGRLAMLVGEPGIGKTRTAQELASYAETRGTQMLWGRCYEEEGAPPYWPWLQSLRSYIQDRTPEQLQSEMGPVAADIAEVLPELREKLPDLEPPPTLEPEQARFRLFDSITNFLKNAAQSQPLMLVLDDLHWADKPSLMLLQFLAREMGRSRLLVVGTYRDVELSRQHPLSDTLAQLSREPVFRREVLGGLSRQDTGDFVEVAAGLRPPPGLVESIYLQTEGNPFFIGEIIKLLAEQGELTEVDFGESPTIRIPEGVREVIGQRLNRLSEQCNRTLVTAAVIGREFDFRLLNALRDELTEASLLELVDEALAAHVIEELPKDRERYQFSHALIQETLSEELSASRKVRLHTRIAGSLEEIYGVNAETHASELAHHFAEAETVLGPEKLIHYSLLAGEQALASYAYEDALTHFERGLVARDISLSGTETASQAAPDEEAAALMFGRARAQSGTGTGRQLVAAFATLSRAFEYYIETGNVALAVAAAEFPIASPGNRIPGAARLLERALTLVPADSHEAGRLLSRYGGVLGDEGDYEGAQQALARGIAIAGRGGDIPLEVQTLTYAAAVSWQHLHWQESVDDGLRAIELAAGDETLVSELVSRFWTMFGLLRIGDLDAARPHALVLRDLAERRISPRLRATNCFVPITYLACLEGNWRAGRESSDRGLKVSPLHPLLLFPRLLLEHETGESAQGEVYLERLLEAMRRAAPGQFLASARTSMAIAAMARISGFPGRLEIAEATAKEVLSNPSVTPSNFLNAKVGLAMLAVQKGDQSAAEELYDYLLGQRGTMIWTISSVDRLLGLLAQTMGSLDQAAEHFEDALAFCRKSGYRPELAWSCHDYADTLLQRRGPGDPVKADALLDEALAISTELGMLPLMERVVALQERAASQPARTPAYPDGLTQREVEVLRLIAAGRTDREIAEVLFISARTVGGHISNILNKTAVANRTEAATYAAREGLA